MTPINAVAFIPLIALLVVLGGFGCGAMNSFLWKELFGAATLRIAFTLLVIINDRFLSMSIQYVVHIFAQSVLRHSDVFTT